MSRWKPGARYRLGAAALELFTERGYERTTVTDIAARAGVTERTFYRHFGDKREVLFDGGADLQELLTRTTAERVTAGDPPLVAVAGAFDRASHDVFGDRLEFARGRATVIAAHPELSEREAGKMAKIAMAVAETLEAAGVDRNRARVAADAGVAMFKIAFARWVAVGNTSPLADLLDEAFDDLRAVTAETRPTGGPRAGAPGRDRPQLTCNGSENGVWTDPQWS